MLLPLWFMFSPKVGLLPSTAVFDRLCYPYGGFGYLAHAQTATCLRGYGGSKPPKPTPSVQNTSPCLMGGVMEFCDAKI